MYVIDYSSKNDRFEITFDFGGAYSDDFFKYVNFLKTLFIDFDYKTKIWSFKENRAHEIYSWLQLEEELEKHYTDACIEKFKNIQNQYVEELSTFQIDSIDYNPLLNKEYNLFEYQKEGIEFLLSRNRAYLTDSPGTGKTVQSIMTFSYLYYQKKIDSILLIVRTGLTYNWQKEILKFCTLFTEDDILIVENKNKKNIFEQNIDKKIIIIPNHLLKDVILSYKKDYKFGKSAKKLRWKEFVNIKEQWQKNNVCLVVDEAHEFTNSDAIRVKALQSHKHLFDYRYFLSATPALNYFERWYNSLNLLDHGSIPMSEKGFLLYIAKDIGDRFNRYKIVEYNEDVISDFKKDILSKYVLRREKSDLEEVKYKQIIEPIFIKMSQLQEDIYRTFTQEEVLKLEKEYDSISLRLIFNKFSYLIQVLDNPLLIKDKVVNEKLLKLLNRWKLDKDPRVEYLDSIIKEKCDSLNDKIVLFDNHPKTIDLLAERYKKYNPIVMHGQLGDSEKEKFRKAELFNDPDSEYRLFIANPQIAGVGISLNKGTDTIIFNTMPNDAVLYAQALERCDRINNTRDSLIQILVIDKSLDLVRYNRNVNRLKFERSYLTKNLSKKELKQLLEGVV